MTKTPAYIALALGVALALAPVATAAPRGRISPARPECIPLDGYWRTIYRQVARYTEGEWGEASEMLDNREAYSDRTDTHFYFPAYFTETAEECHDWQHGDRAPSAR